MRYQLKEIKLDLVELEFALKNDKISAEAFEKALENLELNAATFLASQNEALGFVKRFTVDAASSYADMFGQILDGEKKWSEAFIDILKSVRNELINLLFVKKIAGAIFTGASSLIFGGFLAHGGRATSGKSFLVGEGGPELFTPGISGTVSPNGAGGGNVIYIDARNSNGDADLERKIKSTIRDAAPFLADFAVRTIRDGGRHDPNFLR